MGPRLDEFEVLSTIGSGAHGTVRKVRRRQDGQILVWKELNYGAMSESEKQASVFFSFSGFHLFLETYHSTPSSD